MPAQAPPTTPDQDPTKGLTLYGPLAQVITLAEAADSGPLRGPGPLGLLEGAGLLTDDEGHIVAAGPYEELDRAAPTARHIDLGPGPWTATPGLIDAHTHACFGGHRALDYDLRLAGTTYQEIAAAGGGITSSVRHTRGASQEVLVSRLQAYGARALAEGVTTLEVKSGYGLSVEAELAQLEAIARATPGMAQTLVPTCLAAHVPPRDSHLDPAGYLRLVVEELLPIVLERRLAGRVDIFIEPGAFPLELAGPYLRQAATMGFLLTAHADQFTPGGAELAVETGCLSADHLEATGDGGIRALAAGPRRTTAVALPGASLGLGMGYTPARRLLDAGARLAIASDFNPGSAPMGRLLAQASILAAAERLTMAEVWSALTYRAARALNLDDRGRLVAGQRADFALYPTADYREILYWQGAMTPGWVVIAGEPRYRATGPTYPLAAPGHPDPAR